MIGLEVAGDLSLSGGLDVSFLNGFEPAPGQQFMIASVGGNQSGTFAGLPEGASVPGTDLMITYTGGDGNDAVLFTSVLLGDVNLDGVVDLRDVGPFIAVLGSGTYQVEADTNEDGVVNLLDVDSFISLVLGG